MPAPEHTPRPPSKAAQRRTALAATQCSICRSPFTPQRLSARFCSDACRQKHDRRRRAAIRRARQFFEPADAEAYFGKAALDGVKFDVAERLNDIADACVSASRLAAAQTARERRKVSRLIAGDADRMLANFELSSPFDSLLTNSVVNDMVIGVSPIDRRYRLLLAHIAREAGAPGQPMDLRRAIHLVLWGLQLIGHCAGQQAAEPAAAAATRKVPEDEIVLVDELHKLYEAVTGDDRWQTTPIEGGPPGGPFVELVRAVASRIRDRVPLLRPPPPPRLAENLAALTRTPSRVAKRIRRIRRILARDEPHADE
jgi:hypothetical protein